MEQATNPPRRVQDLCLSAVFLAFLIAPAVAMALRRQDDSAAMVENRRAAEFPPPPRSALDWAGWPRAFEAWHDDHFGLRSRFVRAHNILMIWGLRTSPSPRTAVGPGRWIFTTDIDLDLWRGADPFSPLELEAWKRCLESRQRELEKRGVSYFFVLAPSKAAIYPEFLPAKYRQGGPSRTDQLVLYLARNSSFRVLDLRAALLEEKRNDVGDDYTYFPLGTHWSGRGVMAGLRAIVAELAKVDPAVATVDDGTVGQVLVDDVGDSWAERLYLPDLLRQSVRRMILREPATEALEVTKIKPRTTVIERAGSTLPRALVFHDSFGEPLAVLLGRHFSRSTFVWEPEIDVALLEREKPDFLIHVFNDRVLATLQPQEFDAASDTRAREQFEDSREVALRFDAGANLPQIRAFGEASVALRGEQGQARVACRLNGVAGGFLLPEFKTRRGMHAIVRLEFESPIASTTSVLFQNKSDPTYSRRRQLHYEIHEGHNLLHVEVLEPDLVGRLLFRPAGEPGTFLVSALEVRLVAD